MIGSLCDFECTLSSLLNRIRPFHLTHSIAGVYAHLTDIVEEHKIQRTLRTVREMESPWIVENSPG
jgi:hypothetical protein